MPLRSEELDLEINQISIEIHHSDIFLLHENPLMFLCFFFGRSMDAFRGMERNHPWVLTSPAPRQVLEEAGTSISDRTRSYAADTSHDKHSGCVMGGLTKGSPGANQREVLVLLIFSEIRRPENHLGCLKPCKQQRMFTISTGELAGVLNHQQVYMELEVSSKNPPAESGAIYAHLGGFFPIFQFCW